MLLIVYYVPFSVTLKTNFRSGRTIKYFQLNWIQFNFYLLFFCFVFMSISSEIQLFYGLDMIEDDLLLMSLSSFESKQFFVWSNLTWKDLDIFFPLLLLFFTLTNQKSVFNPKQIQLAKVCNTYFKQCFQLLREKLCQPTWLNVKKITTSKPNTYFCQSWWQLSSILSKNFAMRLLYHCWGILVHSSFLKRLEGFWAQTCLRLFHIISVDFLFDYRLLQICNFVVEPFTVGQKRFLSAIVQVFPIKTMRGL